MEKKRELIWDEKALTNLEKSLQRISESSIQQAEQVEQAVLESIEIVRVHPERYHQTNTRGIIQEITVL